MSDDPTPAVKKPRKKRAVEGENKRDRFVRMADARTNQVLDKIRILGGIANPRYYEYSQDDVDAIFESIKEELESARSKFLPSANKETAFQFQLEKRLSNRRAKTKD